MKRSFAKEGGGEVSVTLAAFGKHPAQNEHIASLGGQTARIGEVYRVLYVAGIPSLLRRWDILAEAQRCPFDHWIVLAYPKGVLVARLIASTDRSGRGDHPFVVVADVAGASLTAVLGGLLEPFDAFVRRCHSFPSLSVLRAALANEQGVLALRANENDNPEGGSIPLASRARFFDGTNFGENGLDFGRVLYTVENRWAPYAPTRGGRLPKMEGNGVALRFPGVAGEICSNVLLWEEFALSRVHEDVPRMYLVPASGSWMDLVVGPPDGAQFYGLGVNRSGMPVETDVPYSVNAEQASDAARIFGLWRDGHLLTAGGGSAGPGDTIRMSRPAVTPTLAAPEPPVPSVPTVASVPSSPQPRTGGFALWGKLGLGITVIAAVVVAAMLLKSGPAPIVVAKNEPKKVVADPPASSGPVSPTRLVADPPASSNQPLSVKLPSSPPPLSTPTKTALEDSVDKATAAFNQKQFTNAWRWANDILSQQPTNPVALELFGKLKQPISISVADMVLDAGHTTNLEVKVTDPLGQTLLPQAEFSQVSSLDQLTWTNSHWVFSSSRGIGRTNHVRWSVGNGITNEAAESLLIVRPDPRTLADEAFKKRDFPEALAQYSRLSGPDGADPTVRERVEKILSAPSIAKLETLKVQAGSGVAFKLLATDVLNRHLTINPAPGGVPRTMGNLVQSATDGEWKFSAAPAATGTLPIAFTVENGQATNSLVVSIEISPAVRESNFAIRSTAPAQKAEPATQPIAKKTNAFSESDFVWISSEQGGNWTGQREKGVWVSRTAVSQKDYEQIMGSSPATTGISGVLPVNNLSSRDAQTYCQKLNDRQKGQNSGGWEYRLPTLDEWYLAAGGGEVPIFPIHRNAIIPVTGENGGFTNSLGLINILGNVKELVLDEDNRVVGSMGFAYIVQPVPLTVRRMAPELYNPSPTVGFRIVFAPVIK